MNNSRFSDSAKAALDNFIAALKKTFEGESWADIEPLAKRVWTACREDEDANWESIKDRLQAKWKRARKY